MKIGVIGTGSLGRALGTRLASLGHEVAFGSRTPTAGRVENLVAAAGPRTSAALPRDAAHDAHVVFLATPWFGTEAAVRGLGALGDKVVVDCTNPLLSGLAGLDPERGSSGGERVAEWADGGRVVKAFNTTGAGNVADPDYAEHRLSMPLCGNDAEARAVVAGLIRDLGFEPLDCGSLDAAARLEQLAMLWIQLAHLQGLGPQIGFALLRRER